MSAIQSPVGVFGVLCAVVGGMLYLEQRTRWRGFRYFPPLLWSYAIPVALSNLGVLPHRSPAYDGLVAHGLPAFVVLMLLSVDVRAALRTAGRAVALMLVGSAGIVVGAAAASWLFSAHLPPGAWKLLGGLAGAWIGGTGNMAAVAGGLGLQPDDLGLAIIADNVIYVVWLPLLLGSRSIAPRFDRWVGAHRVPQIDAAELSADTAADDPQDRPVTMPDVVSLAALVAASSYAAQLLSGVLPPVEPVLTAATYRTLLVTTIALLLSFTPAGRIPGSRAAGMALVYVFLAAMGARAELEGLGDAPLFLLAATLMIAVHGAFCLVGARLLRVGLHGAAIASAANVGGAATAPVVAAHHRPQLVPLSILMALIGYAGGNYLAVLAAQLCYLVS